MTPNPGHQPPETIGKRVRVRLANGRLARDVDPMAPPGWPADTIRWARTGHPFNVDPYELVR